MPNAGCRMPTILIRHSSFTPIRRAPFGIRHELEAIALKAPVQGRAAQAERLGGLADVAVESGHGLLDQEALDVLEAHVLEASARGVLACAEPQIGRLDERPLCHQDGALDRMIELPDVSGPAVLEQRLHRAGLEAGQPFAIALRVLTKEMLREQRQILAAVAEGRQPDLDRVEPEEQVLP